MEQTARYGRFAAPWKRTDGPVVKLTMSELALFLEGSELAGKQPLSAAPYVAGPLLAPVPAPSR